MVKILDVNTPVYNLSTVWRSLVWTRGLREPPWCEARSWQASPGCLGVPLHWFVPFPYVLTPLLTFAKTACDQEVGQTRVGHFHQKNGTILFVKSLGDVQHYTTLIIFPGVSPVCQKRTSSTRAWTVEEPRMEPNWCVLIYKYPWYNPVSSQLQTVPYISLTQE